MNKPQKIALVTGASSGIGLATAQILSGAGYKVYGTSRRGNAAKGASFDILPLDVNSDSSVAEAIEKIIATEGRIDLLINNAGFGLAPAAAEESSMDQARAIFDTNFFGIIRTTLAVLPHMRQQGSGRIINISSVLGFLPMPYMALYSATKHAVSGYSEALDHELRTLGIRVSVVEPAYIKTAFEANTIAPDAPMDAYRDICVAIEKRVTQVLTGADGPDVVAKMVLRAAEAEHPKLHYTPGLALRMKWLRRFAPASVLDAGVRKDLRLPN